MNKFLDGLKLALSEDTTEQLESKFKTGDKVKVGKDCGTIEKVVQMKLSKTPTYKIRLDNGEEVDRYEEELSLCESDDEEVPSENIEDTEGKDKFTSMLQQSIAEEYEASANYVKRAAKCEEHGMEDAAKLFKDIAAEEMVHVGEFQALMEKYGVASAGEIAQGEEEAAEILMAEGYYMGVKGVQLIDHGNWSEPELRYNGRSYNYTDIEETLIGEFKEAYIEEHGEDAYAALDDDGKTFQEWVAENPHVLIEILENSVNEAYVHKVTQDKWNRTPDDYKMIKNGKKYMMYLDPEEHATVLGPVEIVDDKKNEAVNAAKVKQDVQNAINAYFKNDKDALEYVYVDSKKDNQGRTIIEVRAELDYNGMTKLADHLDKVVQKHDKYAYFEQESGGIMVAVFESAQINKDQEKSANEELEYAHNLEDRQKAVEEYKELRYQMMQAGAAGTKPSPAMSKRSSELYRYLYTKYLKEQNKTVNEEEFLEKGEIYARIIQLLDLTTSEDAKAVNLLSDVVNFMDVDQAQKFYEFIQEEIDMNYDEIFGSKKESAMEDAYEYLIEYADNEGLNVSDLVDYDPAEIAEWVSDRMGREVTAEEIEELIQEESDTNYDESSKSEDKFSGLKEHFMKYMSDVDKKTPGYYKNQFKLDKDHEDYKKVLVVEIAKSYIQDMDLQDPLQAQFNVEHEIEANFEAWLKEFQTAESVDEARGPEKPAVHIFKTGVGNMSYPASNMRDAIAYVKKQNLDLANGDYFEIHTGHNLTDTDQLDFWGGTGAGFWRNVLNNPRTKERMKEVILSREIKDIKDLHESVNASSSVYVRAVDEELDSEVIELAKKCKSIYEFEKADPELAQECELFTTINGNEFSGSDLEDLCDNINYSYENAYIEPKLNEWVIEEEQNCIRVGYILVEAGSEDLDESADPDTAIFYSVEACYVDRDPQNYNSYERIGQFTTLEEAREYVKEKLAELDDIKYSGLCIASSEYEYNDENPDELTDTYKILEYYPVSGEVQKFNEDEEISELSFLNSGDIIKTKDGKEAVIEGLLYDPNNIHIGYEITYLDQEEPSYEYNYVSFDDIAEVLSRASNENGTMASMGAAPTVVVGKGAVTAEPTKICEELRALQEALEG